MESPQEFKFEFPQTLIDLWQWAHSPSNSRPEVETPTIHSVNEFDTAYCMLTDKLTATLAKSKIPGINNEVDAAEAASEYREYLFKDSGPETLNSWNYLFAHCKKFLAEKRNPVGYELNEILREALNTLEAEGKIKRDTASRGKKISKLTCFALATCKKGESEIAQREDYLRNQHNVASYTTKARGGDWEKTRAITPETAKCLILELLAAFGSWVDISNLMFAMQKHIPEQFGIVNIYSKEGSGHEEIHDTQNADGYRDIEAYAIEGLEKQADLKIWQLSEIIWGKICEISAETFCLYYVPNFLFEASVTLASLGSTSTIGDQNAKIKKIMESELRWYYNNDHKYVLRIMQNFPEIFFKRCTEIGYKPDLSTVVNNERSES